MSGTLLDLGLSSKDLSLEDLFKLHVRRLAQLEVQLSRIADTLALQLKLQAIGAGLTLTALREAEEDTTLPAGKPAVEALAQTPEELVELAGVYERAVERYGKGNVPLGLDLYAEKAREESDNPEEAP